MNLLPGKITGTGAQTTIDLEGGGSAVSNYPSRDDDLGKSVNIGVRPEDLVDATDPADRIFTSTVNITEALGEVTLLYFEPKGDADPIIGKLQGIHKGLRGNEVSLTADASKVHVFLDTQSLLHRDQPIKKIATRAH